jgi:hypothetical protein
MSKGTKTKKSVPTAIAADASTATAAANLLFPGGNTIGNSSLPGGVVNKANLPALFEKLFASSPLTSSPAAISSMSGVLGNIPKPEIFCDMPDAEYEEEMLRAFFGLPSQAAPEHQIAIQEVRRRLDCMGIVANSTISTVAPAKKSPTTNHTPISPIMKSIPSSSDISSVDKKSPLQNGSKKSDSSSDKEREADICPQVENIKKKFESILSTDKKNASPGTPPFYLENDDLLLKDCENNDEDDLDGDDFDYYEDDTLPLDPERLKIVQAVEHEMVSIYELFASKKLDDEQKIHLLKRKYMQLMHQDIKSRLDELRVKERLNSLENEYRLVRIELEKANVLKGHLDTLCNDLKVENRKLKGEVMRRIELDNRLSGREPVKLVPLFTLPKPHTADDDLRTIVSKLNRTVEIFNAREKHHSSLLDSFDLELQVMQARLFRKDLELDSERRRIELLDRQALLLAKNESELKSQLQIYVDKFKQVEDTLGKSNDLFATFRHEMEQMTNKLAKLERENSMLQTKCNTLSRNVIEMVEEGTKLKQSLETCKNQKAKLEQLCRTLQSERVALKKNLEEANNFNKDNKDIVSTDCPISGSDGPSNTASNPGN